MQDIMTLTGKEGAAVSESAAAVSSAASDRQWNEMLAAKLASRREFIARQLARTPEERLAVMAVLGRRIAALRALR